MGDKRISRHSKGSSLFLTEWQKLAVLEGGVDRILGDTPFVRAAFESDKQKQAGRFAARIQI